VAWRAKLLQVEKRRESSSSPRDVDFSAVIDPLEAAAGRALNGTGRGKCLAAFKENPERFNLLCQDALNRGRNPLALLVRMVFDGDHTRPLPPPKPAPAPPCPDCGVGADLHAADCPTVEAAA
jgi:hypothetical protein